MKIKEGQEQNYQKFVEVNSKDGYSRGVVEYMHKWAELMEKKISEGAKLTEIAEQTSFEADTKGITGFMYGCAVNALSSFWEYGEELRNWHNRKYNHNGEGVVNPAVITI